MGIACILGLVTAFNFCILVWKMKKLRILDFCIDCTCMVAVCMLFSTGVMALTMGMVASMTISLYLLISPLKFNNPFTKWWA